MKLNKPFRYYVRLLHRDIGFLIAGLTLIYCLSGVVLVYRDTGFMKKEINKRVELDPDLNVSELGSALHIKGFRLEKEENNTILFQNGSYNKTTGIANYTTSELPPVMQKLVGFHKTISKDKMHWFAMVYGVLLLFLAISSFWMFKPNTKIFRRGVIVAAIGILIVVFIFLV